MVQSRRQTTTGLAFSASRAQRETNFKTRFHQVESVPTRVKTISDANRYSAKTLEQLLKDVETAITQK